MKQAWFGRLRLNRPKSANALAKAKPKRYGEPHGFEMNNPSTLVKRLRRVRNEIVGIYAELGDVAVETAEAAARDAAIEARERRQVHCGRYKPSYDLDTDFTLNRFCVNTKTCHLQYATTFTNLKDFWLHTHARRWGVSQGR